MRTKEEVISKVVASGLFKEDGSFTKPYTEYFYHKDEDITVINSNGEPLEYTTIENEVIYFPFVVTDEELVYFPSNSDFIKLHYAEECASETHGNYSTYTIFRRAFR